MLWRPLLDHSVTLTGAGTATPRVPAGTARKETALTDNSGVTVPEGRNLVIPTDADYAVMTYAELQGMEMMRVTGLTLMSKELLLGVPHIITRVTYWMPKKDQKGMVSVEATVADVETLEKAIRRGWVPNCEAVDQLRVDPNERVVYNDGGTGIRRQITVILDQLKLIDVGDEKNPLPDRFDRPWPDWNEFAETRYQSMEIGQVPSFSRYTAGDGTEKPFLLQVPRGLYVSAYANEYSDDAETFYLR
jgi:hypothetical protein